MNNGGHDRGRASESPLVAATSRPPVHVMVRWCFAVTTERPSARTDHPSLPSAPTRDKLSAASIQSTTEWTEDTEEDIHFRVFRVFRGPPVELHVPITFQEALAPEALAHVRPNRSS